MSRIPLASADKILRGSGYDRISKEAKEALRDYLEDQTKVIGTKARDMAKHSGRKTILDQDVEFVLTHFGK